MQGYHEVFRVPQKECGKRSSITFFRFRDAFGHFSVTFSDASVTFFGTFLPNSFAGLLLRQGDFQCKDIMKFGLNFGETFVAPHFPGFGY